MASEVRETCREWIEAKHDKCHELADVILWGKLFPADALCPRCRAHAEDWLCRRIEDALRESWAIFDLRNLKRKAAK